MLRQFSEPDYKLLRQKHVNKQAWIRSVWFYEPGTIQFIIECKNNTYCSFLSRKYTFYIFWNPNCKFETSALWMITVVLVVLVNIDVI